MTQTRNAVDNTDPGECNAGFMRQNAMLHIIMVSDEPEQSGGNYSDFVNQIIARRAMLPMSDCRPFTIQAITAIDMSVRQTIRVA